MRKKRILSMFLTCGMLIGILGACAPATPTLAPEAPAPVTPIPAAPAPAPAPVAPAPELARGVIVVSASETPSITPARHGAVLAGHKNRMTHNGLFALCYTDLTPVPDLVADWRAVSDTVFEFTLHEGILFHNGDVMTAYDVAAAFEYNRTFPYSRAFHGSIANWEVVDRLTIRIDTGMPNAIFFDDLAHHGNFVHPRSLIEAGHDFTVNPVGSGPFVFEEWRRGEYLQFAAFEDYFDTNRSPQIAYIHWRIIPEGSSRTIALEIGEADYVLDVALPDVERLEANPNVTVVQRPGIMYQMFIMNNERAPFNNIYVRRAIDMAFDREAMVLASLDGFGIPIWTAFPPFFPGATTEGTRSFDPQGAIALLAEQGIDPATINFEMLVFDEQQRRRAEVAQSNLADIGMTTTISMIDFAAWTTLTQEDAFDSSFGNITLGSLPAFMRGTMSLGAIGANNRSRINNPELDYLINRAIATVDESARMTILHEASIMANEYVGHIGTNMNVVVRAFNARLDAPELGANGSMYANMLRWIN